MRLHALYNDGPVKLLPVIKVDCIKPYHPCQLCLILFDNIHRPFPTIETGQDCCLRPVCKTFCHGPNALFFLILHSLSEK